MTAAPKIMPAFDAEAARRVLAVAGRPDALAAVTLSGEVYLATGPVFGGREAAPTMLEQARERRDLAAELEQAEQHAAALAEARGTAAQAVAAAQQAREAAQAALREAQNAERQATVARDAAGLEAERVAHDAQFRRQQLAQVDAEAAQLSDAATAAEADLARLAGERETIETRLATATEASAAFSVEAAAAEVARWQTAAAVARRAHQDAQTRTAELTRAHIAAAGVVADRKQKIARLDAEAAKVTAANTGAREQLADLDAEQELHLERLRPLEADVAELEAEQAQVEAGDADARAALHAAERQIHFAAHKRALLSGQVGGDLARELLLLGGRRFSDLFGLFAHQVDAVFGRGGQLFGRFGPHRRPGACRGVLELVADAARRERSRQQQGAQRPRTTTSLDRS